MPPMKSCKRILLVSGNPKFGEFFASTLSITEYEIIGDVRSAGEANRLLLETNVDIVIIDAPLSDEFGVEFAQNLYKLNVGVLLLVRSELYERITYKVEEQGIFTLAKPFSKQMLYEVIKILSVLTTKLKKMEVNNKKLQDKMADIRIINHAKWLLIENRGMSEQDAHRYIERHAMDNRSSARETAEEIIRIYED